MTDPIIFISRNRIKEGKLENIKVHYESSIAPVQANKPGTLLQLAYFNDDATEMTIIRLFPNADALDQQLKGADERSKITYQFIEPTGFEIYGPPSIFALEMFKKVAGSGIAVSINPQYMGGFIRPMSG
jgi:hypothetical protein